MGSVPQGRELWADELQLPLQRLQEAGCGGEIVRRTGLFEAQAQAGHPAGTHADGAAFEGVRATLHGLRVALLYGLMQGTESFGRLVEEHPRKVREKVRVSKLAQLRYDGIPTTAAPMTIALPALSSVRIPLVKSGRFSRRKSHSAATEAPMAIMMEAATRRRS